MEGYNWMFYDDLALVIYYHGWIMVLYVSFGTEVRDFTLLLCTSMVRDVGWMWDVRISSLPCSYT
jgi:hypothetical protein